MPAPGTTLPGRNNAATRHAALHHPHINHQREFKPTRAPQRLAGALRSAPFASWALSTLAVNRSR